VAHKLVNFILCSELIDLATPLEAVSEEGINI